MSGEGKAWRRLPSRMAGALAGSALLMDGAACTLLAAGWALALLGMTQLPAEVGGCLLLALGGVALVALCARRWWVAPALAALALGVAAAVGAALQRLGLWLVYASSFLRWLATGAPAVAPFDENGSFLLLQALAVLGLALLAYVLVRRLFFLPLLAALCAGVLVFSAWVTRQSVSAALCCCAAGLVTLLPRTYAARLERRGRRRGGEADGPRDRAEPFSVRAMRPRMQLVALVAAGLAVGLAVLITPADTTEWRSLRLRLLAEDLSRLAEGPFAAAPRYNPNFSLDSLGFGGESGRLGGPAVLEDDVALTVRAKRPLLLKGRVMDQYTGSGWQAGAADGDLRYRSLFWRGYRREVFTQAGAALDREAGRLYAGLTETLQVQVTHRQNRYNSLFYQGGLEMLALLDLPEESQPYFNLRGELYLHHRLNAGNRYNLRVQVWRADVADFEARFTRLEALAAEGEDEAWADVVGRYTQLPETVPAAVYAQALAATADAETPYEKAMALARWLAGNMAYTLEPGTPPEDEDFVAHFLATREGYCTYYATAMAVMARCVGLPSRYVQGFGLEAAAEAAEAAGVAREPGETDRWQATGRTAHAWAELYFYGIGWLPMDPLAWDAAAPLNALPPEEQDEAAGGGAAGRPHNIPEMDEGQGGTINVGPPVDEKSGATLAAAALVLAAAALAAWLAARRRMNAKIRAYALGRVARRYAAPEDRLLCYYRDILRQLELAGVPAEPGETLGVFAEGVDRRLRFEGAAFAPVAQAVARLVFAERPPGEEEIEQAWRYHAKLENHLCMKLGRGRYFLLRALPAAQL